MLNKTCLEFIALLGSREPVPGGGGASALAGSMGAALGSMVGNLTIGKKKYADVEADIKKLISESERLAIRFNELAEEDARAFAPLAEAYGLPSTTEAEKAEKERILQDALVDAARVPLEIAETAVDALRVLDEYSLKGIRMVLSDAGVGAALCRAALQGASLNVLINLKIMKNEDIREGCRTRLNQAVSAGLPLADAIFARVEGEIQ